MEANIADLALAYPDDNLTGWVPCKKPPLAGGRRPAEMFLAFKATIGVKQARPPDPRGLGNAVRTDRAHD